ncbi:MAG: FHA domain-containing protein [Mycobacterium sp.]|uniref:adenylate/guanylate cyclase domain-containing protein n=1 Tax=Mycobacterium sp. TaxID=1785 RepID=UPI001ECA49B5|nr:adenylate/guanylate cyclase domain-containing protein [Mycobacterium sp.]MBW0018891.1 FHA domain-containing protein [Mycobacterium sp.]
MAKLIILHGDRQRVVELSDDPTSLGRAPDNTLWLDDPGLSRRHCEFRRNRNKQWVLHDLGSFNGSFVNNFAVTEHELRPGDRIQLGEIVLYFVPDERTPGEVRRPIPAKTAPGSDPDAHLATSRKLRNFTALMEITKALNSELDKAKVLETIVDKGIELIKAERGFLILVQEGRLDFVVARTRDKTLIPDPSKVISRSVLNRVTKTGEPVLTTKAQTALAGSVSIVQLEVRSLICVPLRSKEGILGALYVDSKLVEAEFNEESQNLLHAFADQAAIAIENTRLFDEVAESREAEKRVRQVFQKYVPADVVREVLNLTDGRLLSAKLTATVLFSDIRSFTSISEKMPPELVVGLLNDYLQRMVDIVVEEGGIVDKFIGDAVMAVFGAPVPKRDDAERAVRAALRMIEAVGQFNEEQKNKGGVEIEIGIGLHTGPLIAGNIGSDRKMEYTVIGDTVNAAKRIESLNATMKTHVLITRECYEATGKVFAVRELSEVQVKGRKKPLRVYEVTHEMITSRTTDIMSAPRIDPDATAHLHKIRRTDL